VSPTTLRKIAAAAVAGGVAWIVFAGLALASVGGQDEGKVDLNGTGDYAGFGLFALCLALSVAGIAALHLHQQGADGRLGRVGAMIAAAGSAGQCIVISGIVVNGAETSWFGVAAPLAILTWFVGSIVLGIAVRRAGVMPGWVGIVLPVVTLFAIIGSDAGTSALIGVFQIVVGLRIAQAAGAAAARTPTRTARRARARPA
jgi:hypothetical protein